MRTIRLAVLICDELITRSSAIRAAHGDYAHILHEFLSLSLALITSDVTFALDAYDVVNEMAYPPDDVEYDGILISGSRASSYEDVEWASKLVGYVKRIVAWKPSLRILGICFGHQIIAKALGFWVRSGEWEVSVTTTHLTSVGGAIFRSNRLDLQLMYRNQVATSLPGARLLGSTVVALNQGLVMFDHGDTPLRIDPDSQALCVPLTSIHVLTLQGSPELTESIMRILIVEMAEELGEELVDDALSRVALPTDSVDKIGRVIWGALGVE